VGDAQLAEAAWRRALQANPLDPAPRHALLKFLLDQKRFDEAYSLTEASLKYTPKDANLLVDRGLLALQFGLADEALANWDEALVVDPGQPMAHLYLAHELDREGKAQPAAAHYKSFLDKVAQQRAQDRPASDAVVGIILRMADCQARSSQTEVAIKSYQMAGTLAAQTGLAKLESVAAVNEAALQAKSGKLDDALRLYQHTLQLDATTGDTSASAVDWFTYGRFLEESGFPDRLAYACMVKSDLLAQSLPKPPFPASVAAARQQIEKRLGAAANPVRRDLEPALQQALKLRR
jgi:tetratricopeptide (TPR) repeat protein